MVTSSQTRLAIQHALFPKQRRKPAPALRSQRRVKKPISYYLIVCVCLSWFKYIICKTSIVPMCSFKSSTRRSCYLFYSNFCCLLTFLFYLSILKSSKVHHKKWWHYKLPLFCRNKINNANKDELFIGEVCSLQTACQYFCGSSPRLLAPHYNQLTVPEAQFV